MIDVLVVGAVGNALKSWELRLKSAVFTLLVVGYATTPILTRGNQATVLVSLQSAILARYCFCYRKATRGDWLCRARIVRSVLAAAGN